MILFEYIQKMREINEIFCINQVFYDIFLSIYFSWKLFEIENKIIYETICFY